MYIDLSVKLGESTPVYPGDPAVRVEPAGVMERDGYSDHLLSVGTHAGTHIDAPAHQIAGGKTLGDYSVDRFFGSGVYVDVRAGYDLAAIKALEIAAGDMVLLHTGMDRRFHEPAYFEDFTPVPEEVAEYLVKCGVSLVGMDMCGPDKPPFPVHKILLGGDVLIAENLTNIGQLAGTLFDVYALPIRLNVDGAPARIVAQIRSEAY